MVEMHEIHVLFQDCIAPRISVGVGTPKCCHCCCCHCCWGWLRYRIYNYLERAMAYIVSSWKAVRWCWQAQVLPSAESPPARHTGLHSSFLETKLFIFFLTKRFMGSQYENTAKQKQRRKRIGNFVKTTLLMQNSKLNKWQDFITDIQMWRWVLLQRWSVRLMKMMSQPRLATRGLWSFASFRSFPSFLLKSSNKEYLLWIKTKHWNQEVLACLW